MPYSTGLIDLWRTGWPIRFNCPGSVHLSVQVVDRDILLAFGIGFPPEVAPLDKPEYFRVSATPYEVSRYFDAIEIRMDTNAVQNSRLSLVALTDDEVPR